MYYGVLYFNSYKSHDNVEIHAKNANGKILLKHEILQIRILRGNSWKTQVACVEKGFCFLRIQLLALQMHEQADQWGPHVPLQSDMWTLRFLYNWNSGEGKTCYRLVLAPQSEVSEKPSFQCAESTGRCSELWCPRLCFLSMVAESARGIFDIILNLMPSNVIGVT